MKVFVNKIAITRLTPTTPNRKRMEKIDQKLILAASGHNPVNNALNAIDHPTMFVSPNVFAIIPAGNDVIK